MFEDPPKPMGSLLGKTGIADLPSELIEPLKKTDLIVRAYMAGLMFIIMDTRRDDKYPEQHLLFYLAQDLYQSVIAIVALAREGLLSVAKRELRFLIESSIKICFIQQKSYSSSIAEKLSQFDGELSSQRISIKNNIKLKLLPENLHEPLLEEIGRLYGIASTYVHLGPQQIRERIAFVDAGGKPGKESSADIDALNDLTARSLAASLVMLFHAVPDYVAGDWLVEQNGESTKWYFMTSRFIAGIDSYFDYKHERQADLGAILAAREKALVF
jgi:hypothetical protein